MAVPENAYKGKIAMNNALGQPIVHKKAVLQSTLAVMKSRFYVDRWLPINNFDGTPSYIGIVYPGSTNYLMHAANRRGNGGTALGTWLNEPLLTLGIILNLIPAVLQQTNIENFIVPEITSRSAYYLSGSFGVEFSINNGAWQKQHASSQAEQNTATIYNVNIADNFEFQQSVKIRLYHLNQEGLFPSNIYSATVQAAPITMRFDETFASVANNKPDSYTYYYTIRGLLMSTIYLDPLGNTQAPIGYYVTGGYWYLHAYSDTVNKNIVTKFGKAEAGKWPDGDPANPQTGYSTWNWYAHHASSQVGACSAIYAPVTTYRRNSDGKHFMNTTLTTPTPDGFYIEDAIGKGWFHIQNQLLINSGSC